MRIALACAAVLTGCLDKGATECADGTLCPAAAVCLVGGGCALVDQVAACSGKNDGDACVFAGSVGKCSNGACVGALCGNGVLDPGEVCDDGNAVSGDGCRGDCLKIEVCGDGVVDVGEQCDDGNHNPADGCDTCMATRWSVTTPIVGVADATKVGLAYPASLAIDRNGNIYVADSNSYVIRRIDATGKITTIAGTGGFELSGDGGPATSAGIGYPFGVAVDGLGDVYIADTASNVVRRVDPNGFITTIAGTGVGGYSGDGGPAVEAELYAPVSVAVDGLGNVYVADSSNNAVRRIDTSGIMTTVAGNGILGFSGDGGPATSAELDGPNGVALDDAGGLLIADTGNNRIRRVDAGGTITTIAGAGFQGYQGDGGAATSAWLALPDGVSPDGAGGFYIADSDNYRIRRVDAAGVITTVAGNGMLGFSGDGGAAVSARIDRALDIAIDTSGRLYISDSGNGRIRRVDAGTITTIAGTGGFGAIGEGGAATALAMTVGYVRPDGAGNIYFADASANVVHKVDAMGVITRFAGTGGLGFAGDGGPARDALLDNPVGLAVDGAGNVYIADALNNRVRRVDAGGVITTFAGTGLPGFSGDGGAATSAQLYLPEGAAVDAAGNVYIADHVNNRIRKVDTNGVITTYGVVPTPEGMAFDAAGNLLVAGGSSRVYRVDPTGAVTTIAGNGTSGFAGDGGPATAAELNGPSDVAIDAAGNIYVADGLNDRLRRIDTAGKITTIAGDGTFVVSGDGGPAAAAQLASAGSVALDGAGNLYVDGRRISPGGVITTFAGLIDPTGVGPIAQARLADPRALAVTPSLALFAGGSSGTVEAVRGGTWLEVVAGRYPQTAATGVLARYRDQSFGDVGGISYDPAQHLLYLTESSANRIHVVSVGDPYDVATWQIAPLANSAGIAGFSDGAAATARFRAPTGLYLDAAAHVLYVADTGNHVMRAIDLTSNTVTTIAGTPQTLGYFGDGGLATAALLYQPRAVAACSNGDLFVADTGNLRVRRISGNVISTVLGVGVAASSGEGRPANQFPVDTPLGIACDALGNVFVTSRTTIRLLPATDAGVVDGMGPVQTIYGRAGDPFPATVTSCLTGIAAVDAKTLQATDSCTGLLVQLARQP